MQKLTVEAGSITASGDFETYLETESKAGAVRVFLPGSDRDYNFYLENAVGNVVIGESVYSGLSNDKKINAQSGKTVKIDCAAGSARYNSPAAIKAADINSRQAQPSGADMAAPGVCA